MMKPEDETVKSRHNRQLRLQKLPVYLMNVLLWIPPQSSLKNRVLLKIMLGFHAFRLILWLAINVIIFYAVFESKMYKFVPTMHKIAFPMNNILLFIHEWFFLYKSLNQKKQLQLFENLDSTNIHSTWPKGHVIPLIVSVFCACLEIALMAVTETTTWSDEQNIYIFKFMSKNTIFTGFIFFCVLSRIYGVTVYFLYTPYIAYLCFAIQAKLEQCHRAIVSHTKLEMENFTNLLHEVLQEIWFVNGLYEKNTGFFVAVSALNIMSNLYTGIAFGKCYSYWMFAVVGCFAGTLATFLWITASVHSKVRWSRMFSFHLLQAKANMYSGVIVGLLQICQISEGLKAKYLTNWRTVSSSARDQVRQISQETSTILLFNLTTSFEPHAGSVVS